MYSHDYYETSIKIIDCKMLGKEDLIYGSKIEAWFD